MDVFSVRRASEFRYTGAPATSVEAMMMPANILSRSFQSELRRLMMKPNVEKERITYIVIPNEVRNLESLHQGQVNA